MHQQSDPHRRIGRSIIAAGVSVFAIAACSAPAVSAPPSSALSTNVKLPVDSDSYLPSTPGTESSTASARALPTSAAPRESESPQAEPQVTVTVTAMPPMNQVTEQPAVLRIPSFDVTSRVISVGLDATGGVVVPDDISVTGWYDRSSWIGAPSGSIVLVGHRDSAVAGAGALYGIEELQVGDSIVLAAQDGEPHRFRVREIKSVEKTRFSTIVEEVFGPSSPYRLTLITCGGAFDEAAGSYLSNIIVTAYPE